MQNACNTVGPIPYPPEYYYTCYFACDNSTVGRNILTNNFVKASHFGRGGNEVDGEGKIVVKTIIYQSNYPLLKESQ